MQECDCASTPMIDMVSYGILISHSPVHGLCLIALDHIACRCNNGNRIYP